MSLAGTPAILLLTLLLCSSALPAQPTSAQTLLVLAKGDKTLSIVDPASLKILARVPVGNDPHEVIASSDGKTAYVSNYGFGAYNTLAVVDLVGQKALASIDLGPLRGPHGLTFVGGKTWFTAEGAKVIGRYDPSTHKIDFVLGTGQNRTHMIYVSPDLQRIVTTNVSSGTVSLIEKHITGSVAGSFDRRPPDVPPPSAAGQHAPGPPPGPPPGPHGVPGGDWDETLIPVGRGSEGFDVSPDGKEIWVANAEAGSVAIIDVASKQVKQTLEVAVRGANRLKFTPDGTRVLISTLAGPDLTILAAASRTVERRLPVGHGAAGILMQPDGARAFVACSPDGYVAIIDLKTLAMTGRIPIGHDPDGLAWAMRAP
jgi:YVTN family beta-propeller protein